MEQWKIRLKNSREAKGLKKLHFAKAVKVSAPTVTDWEKAVIDGGIKEITGDKLVKVCAVLGVDAAWLLTGRESSHAAPAVNDKQTFVFLEAKVPTPESREMQWLDKDEARILSNYRACDERGKQAIKVASEGAAKKSPAYQAEKLRQTRESTSGVDD